MSVRLEVIGSSPAWPNPGGAHSGYLVESNGHRLLLDCGPGVLPRLRDREAWPQLDAIAITHFHLDHWGDLVPWVWGAMFSANGADEVEPKRPRLLVHPGGQDRLRTFGEELGFPDMFDWVFDVAEYPAETPIEVAGFSLTAVRLPHYTLETYGFRVEADGVALAYSGDSGPSERLAELAADADLFVCEATLTTGDADGTPRGHLSLDEAVAAFEASGARRLLLTHRPRELPVPDGLELAYDGLELQVGAP
jgi:ribonuclease BN (tRNA processing enzyme)